jgi:hypothetical protein
MSGAHDAKAVCVQKAVKVAFGIEHKGKIGNLKEQLGITRIQTGEQRNVFVMTIV